MNQKFPFILNRCEFRLKLLNLNVSFLLNSPTQILLFSASMYYSKFHSLMLLFHNNVRKLLSVLLIKLFNIYCSRQKM